MPLLDLDKVSNKEAFNILMFNLSPGDIKIVSAYIGTQVAEALKDGARRAALLTLNVGFSKDCEHCQRKVKIANKLVKGDVPFLQLTNKRRGGK